MPLLTLVGTPRFRPFRVLWMLEELRDVLPASLDFQYQHIPAAPQSDAARANHPMGKVPSLLVQDGADGEFTLIESAAINSWLGDRMREYCCASVGEEPVCGYLVPQPGSRDRASYDSFVHFLMAEADSSGLWIHRKLESLGEKKAFGAVRYALLPARLQFDRAMVGVRAQLEKQRERALSNEYFLVGNGFTAADVLLVHCCDWAAGIEVDKGGWFSKYAEDEVFQGYLGRMRTRPAYLRAKAVQDESPAVL
jgi:glutathione S-transferase|eukprot:CAMPEP_0181167972 /NCGR_PEP_ID=MMETSP1096-20121128/9_1 /TAXON_ID=156174 ORGANISM="Chrysochromulina ericina, Strain CCMP281" /NCGR_SAMPLE_ID=MMETSP1096 /ASSEMBLY_ACC=CAM_ASM_000453 /LENGTH=251 /DNA_ID=CAMNT_0023255285 /DNA_START=112 /DNA_END=867 /DNA_ORIENTATION=-